MSTRFMKQRKTLMITVTVIAICVGLVLYLSFLGGVEFVGDIILEGHADGHIIDKNTGVEDNFRNGKADITITVVSAKFHDVLEPHEPTEITIWGHEKEWSVPTVNLKDNSGKTENNYGENIECDGVVAGPDNSNDNLYVKISVPTTPDGDIIKGMSIKIEMWPTDDAVDDVDGTISPANFDNLSTYDWWDVHDTIDITVYGWRSSLTLTWYDGARLEGMGIDE